MFQKRVVLIIGVVALVFFVIAVRLFALQVFSNSYYRTQARKYATRIELIIEPRGKILDRNGNVLVANKLAFDIFLTPSSYFKALKANATSLSGTGLVDSGAVQKKAAPTEIAPGQTEIVKRLAGLMKVKPADIDAKVQAILERIVRQSESRPEREKKRFIRQQQRNRHKIFSGLTLPQAIQIESHPELFPGFSVSETISRQYLYNDLACHVLGYTGPIWKEEYDAFIENGYFDEMLNPDIDENTYQALVDMGEFKNTFIGRSGIEKLHHRLLTGRYGVRMSQYDYTTKQKDELSRTESVQPADISLTIDLELQKKMDAALKSKAAGAAIVMDIWTGEILGMSSAPAFNLNQLQPPVDRQVTEFISKSPLKPLYNRAVSGEYPPGSIFKIVTGLAALEEGNITPYSPFYCSGRFSPQYSKFKCWIAEHNREHGSLTLEEGFKYSCNVLFFHAGKLAGGEAITKWARNMGFGSRTGIDISGEQKGLVPNQPSGSESKAGKPAWSLADMLNMSIGQGDLMVTPLQTVRMVAAIANGGILVTPYIIKGELPSNPGLPASDFQKKNKPRVKLDISESALTHIRNGMYKVVNSEGGTAYNTGVRKFSAAGKTGTAEVWGKKSHAWFAGFAPFDKPQIAFVVVVEYGGKGSDISAPVVASFLPEALAIYAAGRPK